MNSGDLLDYILTSKELESHLDRINKRLEMHAHAGQYDPARAPHAYDKLVKRAARRYHREACQCAHGLPPWHVMFDFQARDLCCTALVARFKSL